MKRKFAAAVLAAGNAGDVAGRMQRPKLFAGARQCLCHCFGARRRMMAAR